MKMERWIVLSDLHWPFHDKPLQYKVCKLIMDIKPHGCVINGDGMDLYTLGSYNRLSLAKLTDITLAEEYRKSRIAIRELDSVLPRGCVKHYLEGNHEDRYWREVEDGDNAKYGSALLSPAEGLQLKENGWQTHGRWMEAHVRLGEHLEVWHGNYACIHVAKKAAEEARGSVIVGHSHRLGTFVEGNFGGWNLGFLGNPNDPHFHYMSRNKRRRWTQSFGIVNIDGGGKHYVEPIQVFNGSFVYGGKEY